MADSVRMATQNRQTSAVWRSGWRFLSVRRTQSANGERGRAVRRIVIGPLLGFPLPVIGVSLIALNLRQAIVDTRRTHAGHVRALRLRGRVRTGRIPGAVRPHSQRAGRVRRRDRILFLRKVTRWESGAPIAVVDQRAPSAVRERFSTAVHRRPVAAVIASGSSRSFRDTSYPLPSGEVTQPFSNS